MKHRPDDARGAQPDKALAGWRGEGGRFVRFCCVGLGNTGVHLGVVLMLVEWGGVAPPLANALAFACANMVSYALNARWTFRHRASVAQYLKFFAVSLVGLGISWASVLMALRWQAHYVVGVLVSVVLVALVGYALNRYFVFRG